jgi:hypothetical protein
MESFQRNTLDISDKISVARGGSFDSSPTKRPPDLPAKPSKDSLRRFQRMNSPEEKNNEFLNADSIEIISQSEPNVSPGFEKTNIHMSTFKPQSSSLSKPKSSSFSPKLQKRVTIVSHVDSDCTNGKQPNFIEPERIYDQPIPIQSDNPNDNDSSSDEEPIYHNILDTIKKQQYQNRMTYTSLDVHKQRLERDARNLSCRFSLQPDLQLKMAKEVKPPMLKPIKSITAVKGVTEEESTTEQGKFGLFHTLHQHLPKVLKFLYIYLYFCDIL